MCLTNDTVSLSEAIEIAHVWWDEEKEWGIWRGIGHDWDCHRQIDQNVQGNYEDSICLYPVRRRPDGTLTTDTLECVWSDVRPCEGPPPRQTRRERIVAVLEYDVEDGCAVFEPHALAGVIQGALSQVDQEERPWRVGTGEPNYALWDVTVYTSLDDLVADTQEQT